jgi:tetratricopeptide (TPR) repeat protein
VAPGAIVNPMDAASTSNTSLLLTDARQIDLLNSLARAEVMHWKSIIHQERGHINKAFVDCLGARSRDAFNRAASGKYRESQIANLVDMSFRYALAADMAAKEVGIAQGYRLELARRYATSQPPVPAMVDAITTNLLIDNPHDNEATLLRARACMMGGDYASALRLYTDLTKRDPSNGEAWGVVGYLRALLHETPKALSALRRSVALGYKPAEAWLRDVEHPAQAVVPTDLMLTATDPQLATDSLLTRGGELLKSGDLAGAESAYQAVLRDNPSSGPATAGLGDVYLRRGELYKAVDTYSRALTMAPSDADGFRKMGLACELVYDKTQSETYLDRAIECFQRAIAIRSSFAVAREDLERVTSKKLK